MKSVVLQSLLSSVILYLWKYWYILKRVLPPISGIGVMLNMLSPSIGFTNWIPAAWIMFNLISLLAIP